MATITTEDAAGRQAAGMPSLAGRRITGDGGWTGTLVGEPLTTAAGGVGQQVRMRVDPDGPSALVPLELFQERRDGTLFLPLTRAALDLVAQSEAAGLSAAETLVPGRMIANRGEAATSTQRVHDGMLAPASQAKGTFAAEGERIVVPLVAEELRVSTEQVETGGVRVHKTVTERQEEVTLPLLRDEVSVERVPVNRMVEGNAVPPVRQEGDVMVVPLLEEVLVVEKRLMVREELRVHLRRVREDHTEQVTLRREEAHTERFAPGEGRGASVDTAVLGGITPVAVQDPTPQAGRP